MQAGMLSLLQDSGRRGQHRLGLTTGGPLDGEAFHYCNSLLQNPPDSTAIEVSVGGLQLSAQVDTFVCLTGAAMPLTINGEEKAAWEVHPVRAGDTLQLGFARAGCRAYLGVADGFQIAPSFSSTATVASSNASLLSPGMVIGSAFPVGTTIVSIPTNLARKCTASVIFRAGNGDRQVV